MAYSYSSQLSFFPSLFSGSFVRHSVTDTNCYQLERLFTQPIFERMLLTVFTAESLGSPFILC